MVGEISARPFDQYVEENIFRPLGMNNSTFQQPLPDRLSKQMAIGYTYSGGDYKAEPFEYVVVWPAGSMSSTSADMARFMIAHLQNGRYGDARILQDATARRMHSLLFTSDPRVSGWDYGFMQMHMNNQSMIGHGGDTIQFHTLLMLLPEHNLGLFVSYNSQGGAAAGTELLQEFLDRYYPYPVPAPRPSGSKDQSSNLTGSYLSSRRPYTTYDKLTSLFLEVNVAADGGNLTTTQAVVNADKWDEVAPMAYRKADILAPYDGLIFHADAGRIDRFYKINDPAEAFERAAWYDSQYFNLGLLAVCVILFLSAIIFWPLCFITGRSRFVGSQDLASRYAHWLAGTASVLDLIFLTGLLAAIAVSPMDFIYSVPKSLTILLSLAIAASILAVASAVMAALIWRRGVWHLRSRAYYTLVVLADLAFIWWLNNWNLLGFKY
ncbi:MAG TPA: serine hydrolase, partial [Methanotrichaceae archaeon]|nr:serine hydrolase [Methanotrichaceae archaeon]